MKTSTVILFLININWIISNWRVSAFTNCWDGTNAPDYTGTISTCILGHTCQNWADDSPQAHGYHTSNDAAFVNYCRDPLGDTGTPWCFSTDSSTRWCYCDIPLCTNAPCVTGNVVGQSNPSTLSTNVDTNTGINYLQKDTYIFDCCGTVSEWRFYIKNSGTIRLQIWRLDSGSGNYVLKGENVYTYSTGESNAQRTESVVQANRLSVEVGDLIGWYTVGTDMVTYAGGSTNMALLSATAPSVGDSVSFGGASTTSANDYAIGVVVAPSLAPYFTNAASSVDVSASAAVGTNVYTLSGTDDDADDISTLVYTMSTSNTYFEVSGSAVVVKSALTAVANTAVTLDFIVTDHCFLTGTFSLPVNIQAITVALNLPDTASVDESTTVETLLHTMTITPTNTYTCTIDSYSPTRVAGNPFLVQTISPGTDIGIYLKSAAGLVYADANTYNVTVTCTDGASSSGTSYLLVNVNPNSQPVFNNFVSSVSISALTTNQNDVIYTADVTDADGDAITMTMTCVPAGCPFTIANDGQITATEDLSLHTVGSYTITLTAADAIHTVTSSTISLTITDINIKPVFTNIPKTITTLENVAAGTTVFTVSQSDGNGDTPTFSATYSNTDCSSMFTVDSTTGAVTNLYSFDYETLTTMSCTLTLTMFDGRETSDAATLVIDVSNVDEAPVMTSSVYLITTDEVADGTALTDVNIAATDPEGTAVTLSLNCPSDAGYLTIDASTGIVTMATAYDLETASVDSKVITCDVLATDATSQTATATLEVTVNDANDNAPVFTSASYTVYLQVGHSAVGIIGTVTATDADRTSPNNAITYSLSPTTKFNIDSSGNVYNTADLSGDAAGTSYTLTATATDGGTPALSDTTTVVVIISTTTTTSTTVATAASSSSSLSGFFDSTSNIVLLALGVFLALLLLGLLALLLWRFCCQSASAPVTPVKKMNNINRKPSDPPSYKRPYSNEKSPLPLPTVEPFYNQPPSEHLYPRVSPRTPTRISPIQAIRGK